MYDQSLHVDITASAEEVVNATGLSDDAFAKLTAAVSELTAEFRLTTAASEGTEKALVVAGGAAEGTAVKVKVVKDEVNTFTASLEKASGGLGVIARFLGMVGLEAEGLAARLEAATGAAGKMGDAVPGLLAVGAALAGVFSAFEFAKDGVEIAKEFESSLETLRAAVEAQGGSWDKASDSIQRFLDIESAASGFTQNDLLLAMNRLVTSGSSVSDAMHIVSIAEEEAVARHSDVLSVVNLLIQAESGRAQGLVKLDPHLRDLIKSHADLHTVMLAVHDLAKKQLDDDDSLDRADARRKAAFDAAAKTLGDKLLPFLTDLDYMLIAALKNGEEFGQGFGTVLEGVTDGLAQAVRGAGDLGNALNALMKGNPILAGSFYADALSAARTLNLDNQKAASGFSDIINFGHEDPRSYGRNAAKNAVQEHDAFSDQSWSPDFNPTLGNSSTSNSQSKVAAAQKQISDAVKDSIEWLKREREEHKITIDQEIAGLDRLLEKYKMQPGQRRAILDEIAGLKKQQRDDDAKAAEAAQRANLQRENDMVADAKASFGEHSTQYRKALSDEITYLETWLAAHKTANKALAEDFRRMLDQRKTDSASVDAYDKQQADDLLKKQQDAYDKIAQSISTLADQGVKLFNSLFNSGKSGAQSFGQVFKSMIDDIIAYVEKSALTSLLMRALNFPTTGPDGKSGIPGMGGWGGALLSLFGASSGGGINAGSYGSNIANDPAFGFGGIGNPNLPNGGVGGDGSLAFGNGQYPVPNIAGSGGGQNPNSLLGMLTGGNPWGAKLAGGPGGVGAASLGSFAAAGLGGAIIGQTLFGGKGFADAGGAIGGMAALALAGPAGWGAIALMTLGGALLGAGGGSLFGNHFNPADEPDINDPSYGQELADLQGKTSGNPMNANGKQYVMDSQTASATNGKGWNILMESFVNQFRGKEDELPASLRADFGTIAGLWGGATNQADFNNDGKDGNLDIGGGTRANYMTFVGMISKYGAAVSQLMSNYQTSQSYSAAISGQVSPIASYTPSGAPDILHSFPDSGGGYQGTLPTGGGGGTTPPPIGRGPGPIQPPGGVGGPAPRGGPAPQMTVINNHVTVHGSVTSQHSLDDHIYAVLGVKTLAGNASIGAMNVRGR